jgi:hypothetical protein
MNKYDGILFGNGLTLNFLSQLRAHIPPDKHYLISIDSFLKAIINEELSEREQRKVFKLFYKKQSIDNLKFYEKMQSEIAKYYKKHDANIEYHLGVDLFQDADCRYNYPLMKSLFPFLYNIWHDILIDYINHMGLDSRIKSFIKSVDEYTNQDRFIFTTNFDRLFDGLNPDHLHGRFVMPFKKMDELIFKHIDDEEFLYKCIWGWNGVGKLNFIDQYRSIQGYNRLFDFKFFFGFNFHIKHLLIYGLGFQKAGYIKKMAEAMPKYNSVTIGGVVDEHVLMRLQGLQTQKQLDDVTFTYYAESELKHFEELVDYYDIKRVTYKKSSEFLFTIY